MFYLFIGFGVYTVLGILSFFLDLGLASRGLNNFEVEAGEEEKNPQRIWKRTVVVRLYQLYIG